MQPVGELDSGTIERLEKQGKLLLTIYQAELAKDPSSQGTESSRSNVIALRHTVQQIYGDAAVSRILGKALLENREQNLHPEYGDVNGFICSCRYRLSF